MAHGKQHLPASRRNYPRTPDQTVQKARGWNKIARSLMTPANIGMTLPMKRGVSRSKKTGTGDVAKLLRRMKRGNK